MNILNKLFQHLEHAAAERERRAQEAFLADAADIYDVEARLREWDRRQSSGAGDSAWRTGSSLH